MSDSNEIIELARRRLRQLPKRTPQEELARQQEYIRNARINGVFDTDLSDEEMAKLANTSTTSTGRDGSLTATQLRETILLPSPAVDSVVFSLQNLNNNIREFFECGGICMPHRPEVLRKTVHSTIVEPLALPAGKEDSMH